jgi:energy-coupling factor transport system permease protein
MRLFVYREGDSFLHRLNPLTKLVFASLVMLLLTVIVDPITPFMVALALLIATSTLGRVPVRALVRTLGPFAAIALGILWTTALFYVASPTDLARPVIVLGPIVLTDQGLAYGFTIMFRILGVFAASLLFALTTDPTDLVVALIQQLHLSHRFGYGALAAYRFVPLFDTELSTIRAAHRIRGVGDRGGPLAQYRRFVGYMVPLLAGGVRKAERVALAMDARGFDAYPTRTYYRRAHFSREDVLFSVGATAAVVTLLVILKDLGWLGVLIPPFIH